MADYIAQSNGSTKQEITEEQQIKASQAQAEDKESTSQKESQVSQQASNAASQAQGAADDAEQDEKSLLDKIKKELGKIPQKIEDTEDDIIDQLRGFLGSSPNIKKVKVKTSDGLEYNKPDFDPDKSLNSIKSAIDPVLNTASPQNQLQVKYHFSEVL